MSKIGDHIRVIKGSRRKGETGTLVRFEWVNVLEREMWLVDFDNDMPDGYVDESDFKVI